MEVETNKENRVGLDGALYKNNNRNSGHSLDNNLLLSNSRTKFQFILLSFNGFYSKDNQDTINSRDNNVALAL